MPKSTARISRHGDAGEWTTPMYPKIIIAKIPHTRWWTWVPPTSTLPGHQLTCARIMCVLKRMNPKVPTMATKKRNAARRPLWTIS